MDTNTAQPEIITVPIEIREVPMYQPQQAYSIPSSTKQSSNTGLNIFLILILLSLLGIAGYLLYKYIIQPNTKKNTNTKKTQKNEIV